MIPSLITVGNKIDIYRLNKSGDRDNNLIYVSQVLDVADADSIKIAVPIMEGKIVPLEPQQQYILCFYTMKGLFQCKAIIMERHWEGNIPVLSIQLKSDLEKFQRRQYYRLECASQIKHRLVTEEELELEENIRNNSETEDRNSIEKLNQLRVKWLSATITDISGGGARFNSGSFYKPGDRIKIDISLEIKQIRAEYELDARIISCEPIFNRSNMYESRVEFSDINNGQREAIIKFVFEEERKMRRKEKGLV